MKKTRRNIMKRAFAVILSILIMIEMIPLNLSAVEEHSDAISANTDQETTEFHDSASDEETETLEVSDNLVLNEAARATVTVISNGGGQILFDGSRVEVPSITVDIGTTVELTVKAEEGYQIGSVYIDGVKQNVTNGRTEFVNLLTVSADMKVNVTYIKVYTAIITNKDKSEYETTIKNGTSVIDNTICKSRIFPKSDYDDIRVTINSGYHIISTEVDKMQTDTSNVAKTLYEVMLSNNEEHTIVLTIVPVLYQIKTMQTENGSISSDMFMVAHGESTNVRLCPDVGYVTKRVAVNDTSVTDIKKDAAGFYFTIDNVMEEQEINVEFAKIATASKSDLQLKGTLRISEDGSLCVMKKDSKVLFSTNKAGIRVYDADGRIDGNENTNVVEVDITKAITKIELFYQDESELVAEWHEVKDIRFVIDEGDNVLASLLPLTEPNENDYYSSNIAFEAKGEDTGDYSGLETVEYWITCDGVKGEVIPLYTYDAESDTEIKNLFRTDQLIVDATLYNSKDVKVTLHVVDRAGNDKFADYQLKINSTRPTISLDISGTKFINAQDSRYYNEKRELTIKVNDRDDTFVGENVIAGLAISKNGNPVAVDPGDIVWEHSGCEHVGKYLFTDQGHYEWSISYENQAGLKNDDVIIPKGKDIYDFYIDTDTPYELNVTYEPSFIETILETITFGFYKAPVKVRLEAVDDLAGIAQFEYKYTGLNGKIASGDEIVKKGNIAYTEFTIPEEFRGSVSFIATDRAGNKVGFDDNRVIVIDTIAPEITVEWDGDNAPASKETNCYFSRTAKIKIQEANFFTNDIMDGMLVICQTVVRQDGSKSEISLIPEFVKEGDWYVATVSFNEEGDYILDIQYTDRSGNVYDSYEKDSFTIDKSAAVIRVLYNDEEAWYTNNNQFSTDRKATIQIIEHNFNAEDVAAKVMKNGMEDTSYADYLKNPENWTSDGNVHTAAIRYTEEGHYTFDIGYTDGAGNTNDGVNYGVSVAPTGFTIDKSEPDDMDIQIENVSVAGSMELLVFDKFYNHEVIIQLLANDLVSGIQSLKYQKVTDVSFFDENGPWMDYNADTGIVAAPNEKVIIYFKAEDRAGNVRIIRSKGIVIDNQKPIGETNAPEIDIQPAAPNVNGIHQSNVDVALKVVDPKYIGPEMKENGYYSGLKKITYRIYTKDTDAIEKGTLFEAGGSAFGVEYDTDQLAFAWSGSITIDAARFNSNQVIVEVTAIDNAGNTRTSTTTAGDIKIDTTAPKVDIRYDNNKADTGFFFKEDRTATIVVSERNFIPEGFKIYLSNIDGEVPVLSNWTMTEGTGNQDDTTWTATITYNTDGNYEFSAECIDMAGWTCNAEEVNYGNSIAPTKFVVDKMMPVIEVSYDNNSANYDKYYKVGRTATIVITEHNFDAKRVKITHTAMDGAIEVNRPKISGWISNGDQHIATIQYETDAKYTFDISVIDKAGNASAEYPQEEFVVDTVAPHITVTFDRVTKNNHYKSTRIATIKIDEANFNNSDLEDGLLVINCETELNNKPVKEAKLKPKFRQYANGNTYIATVSFDMEADYTLDIAYTDRAGNKSAGYKADKFTIDKTQPVISIEKANGAYVNVGRTAKITVVEHNFNASGFVFNAKAYNVLGKSETNKVNLTSKKYKSYLQNPDNWTNVAADTWSAEITFDTDGNYTIGATYKDPAGNAQVSAISDTFCVDQSKPSGLKVTYKPTFVGTVLETITFGFYQAPVTVKIEARDETAGIDYFVYSYQVDTDASTINSGKKNQKIAATRDKSTNRWYETFEIPQQFRGHVSFEAYDKAGNQEVFADEKVLVVDDVAPDIQVVYDNHKDTEFDGVHYYKADRTATVTIREANFFGEADMEDNLLEISVGKRLEDVPHAEAGSTSEAGKYTYTKMKPEFTKDGDKYTAKIHFDENADYTFDIKYTDRSGNVYDAYKKDSFTVDKTRPVINVFYNDADVLYANGNQFRTNRKAVIQITEHNFNAEAVSVKVMKNGIEDTSYADYLKNPANWTSDGNVHTAAIRYTEEGHYTFEIGYRDKAGNTNKGVNYGDAVAPTAFTIDQSAPTELDIRIDDVSVKGSMTSLAFDTFYNRPVTVRLSADYSISGMQSMQYQKVPEVAAYNRNGTWLDYNPETGIVVAPSEKMILYFRAEDRAGNVSIIRSTGIVVDNQKPVGETRAPEIDILPATPNANGIYQGNVDVALKVVDPKYHGEEADAKGYYSGLRNIRYRIYTTDTDAVEEGTLFELGVNDNGAVFDADRLVSSWTGHITIDAARFNSNQVVVEVEATDDAGNTRISTTTAGDIKIDMTAPAIDITYDNNEVDGDSFFKADRTATIVVTERNFKPEEFIVNLTNADGEVPALSDWTMTEGTGNLDDTRWTATIAYQTDGNYEFSAQYTDMAGWTCDTEAVNYGNSIAPTKFIVDKTLPVIAVTYDNNDVSNGNYYKAVRTATVVITDHNFDAARVVMTHTAMDGNVEVTKPSISEWTTSGDNHTATIYYGTDARYTFDIAVIDQAGNASAAYAQESFYIDTTMPALEITGVADQSANNGEVIPVITYSDTNFDENQVAITLTGAHRKNVALDGNYEEGYNGGTFRFNNFANEKEMDDIYTLTASLTDKAGNMTEQTITFSVNRFGSTYALSETTEKLNGTYVTDSEDVVIRETNADRLSNIKVTLYKDNETMILQKDKDYKMELKGGNGQWYQYTYTVFAKNFEKDGVYSITVESDDQGGNVAKNDQDTKNKAINFGVDHTLPIINIFNLENRKTYAMDNLTVEMSVKDNLKLDKVIVELDGEEYKTWTDKELDETVKNGGNFTFDISGDSTEAHNLVVYAVDAAGNGEKISDTKLPENVEKVENFYVTTNLWVRYYTNKALFFGSIGGVILLAGLIVALVVYRKKKNEGV